MGSAGLTRDEASFETMSHLWGKGGSRGGKGGNNYELHGVLGFVLDGDAERVERSSEVRAQE